VRARIALSDIQFDSCFSSPHTRARQTTEIVWQQWQQQDSVVAREPIYLPSLAEVDLGWFQGLKNGEHVLTQEVQCCGLVWRSTRPLCSDLPSHAFGKKPLGLC
jgi:hypothetical protein